ncbi:Ran-binding protein 3-like, partial [Striga asiatica]
MVDASGDRLYGPWLLAKNKGPSRTWGNTEDSQRVKMAVSRRGSQFSLLTEDNEDSEAAQAKSPPRVPFTFSTGGESRDKIPLEDTVAEHNEPKCYGAVREPRSATELSFWGHQDTGKVTNTVENGSVLSSMSNVGPSNVRLVSAGSGLDPTKHQVAQFVDSQRHKNNRNTSGSIVIDLMKTAEMVVDPDPPHSSVPRLDNVGGDGALDED